MMCVCMPLLLCRCAFDTKLPNAGARRLIPPAWRKMEMFDNIYQLTGVPVITVQLRYDGWVTELQDPVKARDLTKVTKPPPWLFAPFVFMLYLLVIFSVCAFWGGGCLDGYEPVRWG
jgi:hypothetical protein